MASYEDENVLVVSRGLFEELGTFQGLSAQVDHYLPAFLDPANNFFLPRENAEDDPSHKQIIPYAIFRHRDRILRYIRGKKSGEQRLASKASIGIGGHINQHDASEASLHRTTYMTGVEREISEELVISGNYTQRVVALINDDSNPVGDSEDFIKILANEQDRDISFAGVSQIFMHGGTGPHVKPTCRRVRQQDT